MTDLDLVTKRLHVSGLTPAITADDLARRLGAYGSIKALDGFGLLDGVGRPRKFGYITMEGTKPQLQKCMTVLSGTVWKGTKLRVGVAKPDFSERISRENAPPEPEDSAHPAKRRKLARGVRGVEAADMTLVTPENASQRSGWKVLPSGRLIRPARMRPAHPLPPPLDFLRKAEKEKNSAGGKAKKARVKPPSTRARRKTIDPVRWGSVHLKGAYLDSVGVDARHWAPSPAVFAAAPGPVSDSDSDSDAGLANASESAGDDESESELDEELPDTSMVVDTLPLSPSPPPSAMPSGSNNFASAGASAPGTSEVVTTSNLREETSHTLAFLRSLFADADAQGTDWGGAESADEEGHAPRRPLRATEMDPRDDGIVEEVPAAVRVADPALKEDVVDAEDVSEEEEDDDDDADEHAVAASVQTSQAPPPAVAAPKTSLKDLFAPREEEAGFSLLGHLDLDLELDDEFDVLGGAPAAQTAPAYVAHDLPSEPLASTRAGIIFDPSDVLFFPRRADDRAPKGKRRAKDITELYAERGWDWRSAGFFRTESEDEMRARWEAQKLELTREWKRRHREAIKSRRRRGGIDGE